MPSTTSSDAPFAVVCRFDPSGQFETGKEYWLQPVAHQAGFHDCYESNNRNIHVFAYMVLDLGEWPEQASGSGHAYFERVV